jgi:MFS family permease
MLAGMLLMSITTGRLVSRFGRYKLFVVAGTAVLATAIGLMSMITLTTGAWVIAGMLFLVGAGLGLFMQMLILAVQNALPHEYMGTGTATVTFFRTLGGAIGSAVLGAVLVLQEKTNGAHYVEKYGPKIGPLQAFTHGMDRAFLYALPVAVLAFLLSFLLREVRLRSGSDRPAGEAAGVEAPFG